MGDGLIQQGQAIAHASCCSPREWRQGFTLVRDTLLTQQPRKMVDNRAGWHLLEVELQASAEHRHRDLLRIRRRKDEFKVFRRLLQRLQHRVEGGVREHVDFVDDIHLEASAGRGVLRRLEQLAHLVDLGIGRGIHLEEVHEPATVDFDAGTALSAGLRRDPGLAVQALSQDPGNCCLAHATGPGKQVGMVQSLLFQCVPQGLDHVLLADKRRKTPGSVLAREDEVSHARILQRQ